MVMKEKRSKLAMPNKFNKNARIFVSPFILITSFYTSVPEHILAFKNLFGDILNSRLRPFLFKFKLSPTMNNNKSYSDKLKDPRWQKKRLEILQRDNWACVSCGSEDVTLHVHHKVYEKNQEPWDIDSSLLITLCEDCHESETSSMPEYSALFIDTFKRSPFLADDLRELASGINQIKLQHLHNVVASAYAFAFKDNEMQALIIEMYAEYLKSKRNS
jgi:hypothetical protein